MKLNANNIIYIILLYAISLPSFALKQDNEQPINITSDNQSLDLEKNIVTFSDNVVITQGTMKIKANKVTIHRPSEQQKNTTKQSQTVEATGNPVTFSQQLDNGKPIDGKAQKVHYDLDKGFLTLTGNAELKQLDSFIKSEIITYDVKKQKLEAKGKKSRVTTILNPQQLQENKQK